MMQPMTKQARYEKSYRVLYRPDVPRRFRRWMPLGRQERQYARWFMRGSK